MVLLVLRLLGKMATQYFYLPLVIEMVVNARVRVLLDGTGQALFMRNFPVVHIICFSM